MLEKLIGAVQVAGLWGYVAVFVLGLIWLSPRAAKAYDTIARSRVDTGLARYHLLLARKADRARTLSRRRRLRTAPRAVLRNIERLPASRPPPNAPP